jgi:nucleoside-diphosphate-sugar epimerase
VTCLVSDGMGHVGSFLVRRLLADGHDVHLLLPSESDLWRMHNVKAHDMKANVTQHRCSLDHPAQPDDRRGWDWDSVSAGYLDFS